MNKEIILTITYIELQESIKLWYKERHCKSIPQHAQFQISTDQNAIIINWDEEIN